DTQKPAQEAAPAGAAMGAPPRASAWKRELARPLAPERPGWMFPPGTRVLRYWWSRWQRVAWGRKSLHASLSVRPSASVSKALSEAVGRSGIGSRPQRKFLTHFVHSTTLEPECARPRRDNRYLRRKRR